MTTPATPSVTPSLKPERVVRDISDLPTIAFGTQSVSWWGTLGFMVIEGMTLALCAAAYFYLRRNFLVWPPEMTPRPALLIPIIQLGVMILSIGPMYAAARAAYRLDRYTARNWLLVEIVFKVVILVLRWYEFKGLNTQWNSDAYGSILWTTLGLHTALLVIDAAEDIGIAILMSSRGMRDRLFVDVTDDAMYWYFTVGTWVALFAMLFLTPYIT
jgi:cytochrome c oxidase subunit I+III